MSSQGLDVDFALIGHKVGVELPAGRFAFNMLVESPKSLTVNVLILVLGIDF